MTELQAARTGMYEYQIRLDGKNEEQQEKWNVARWIAWQGMLMSPYIKAHQKPKTAQAFCRFPWERPDQEELAEKAKQYRVTPEEEAALNKILMDWEASHNKT